MNIPYVFRKCSNCGNIKLATEKYFYKSKTGKWGLTKTCKECKNKKNKEGNRKRYNDNEWRDEYNKKRREKYSNDKEFREKEKERNRNKYRNDEKLRKRERERNNKYNKERYHNDEEFRNKKLTTFKHRYYNDEEFRIYRSNQNKNWRENNPDKVFNLNNKRRNKLENQGRGITDEQYIECNKWFNWKCAYSGEKIQKNKSTHGRTLDHIVALDNRGLNEPWNVIPMRKGYNSSKWNRESSLNWYMEQEYFDEERLQRIVEWQIYAYEKWGGEEFGELILITDLI